MKTFSRTAMALLLVGWAGPAAADEAMDADLQLVLVSSDTWLHAAPDAKAHRFRVKLRLPSMKRTYKKAVFPLYATARPKRVLLFRLAEPLPEGKGWAHLRPLDEEHKVPNGCDFLTPGRDLEIDLYVRTEALLVTLKEPFRANYEDGTGLELKPGVVIRPTQKPKRFIAETPHLQVELPLPPDATARTFSPQPGFDFGKAPAWAKGPVKLKIGPEMQATLFGVDIGLQAVPTKRGHARWLMTDVGSCAKLTGFGRYRPLDREPTSELGGILGMIPEDALRIAKGSQVFWPDGKEAGHTGRALTFEPEQAVWTKLANRRCIKHAFFADEKQVLCFPTDPVAAP